MSSISSIHSSRYRPVVRIGNWFEDICLEQDKLHAFKNLRDNKELLVEKTRHLFDNFHKEIELEAPKESIRFGAIVQLVPLRMNICEDTNTDILPALSIIINESVVRHTQNITEECELTIAPSIKACVRNSFRIINEKGTVETNEVLKYGQHFRLQCVGNEESLLLFSTSKSPNLSSIINTSFDSTKYGEINLPLGLVLEKNCGPGTNIPSAYTNWVCSHIDPNRRFETDNSPLPSNQPLIITHMATNRNLAAENVVVQTLFGPEYLVCVQNYKDIHKKEKWQNVWMICNGHYTKK